MGRTGHGQISLKLKRARCNSKYRTAFKYIKINTDLNEYVPKTLVKIRIKKNPNMLVQIYDSVKSSHQKCIISHPRVIQFPIADG